MGYNRTSCGEIIAIFYLLLEIINPTSRDNYRRTRNFITLFYIVPANQFVNFNPRHKDAILYFTECSS